MSKKKVKVLLINPPARSPVLRDYYCSTFPKTNYYWHPIDLLSIAAILRDQSEVKIIDAIILDLSKEATIKSINDFNPDTIFSLVSSITTEDDMAFLQSVAKKGRRIVIGGEKALDPKFDFKKYPFVDGLLLDFTANAAIGFLLGESPEGRVRTKDYIPPPPPMGENYSIGIMPHADLAGERYRLPLWRGRFFSLLTDFGCPFTCSFCNSGRKSLGFKIRDIDEIAEELKVLKQLGAKNIYLKDMTFGADRENTRAVLELLRPFDFRLRGYIRADLVTKQFARQLKTAGFELAQIGIETPSSDKRRRLNKHIENSKIEDAFRLLRAEGISAGAHFLIGMKNDSLTSPWQCTKMAKRLKAAYCSINIYQPRFGIDLLNTQDNSCSTIFCANAKLSMNIYNFRKNLSFIVGDLLSV